MDAAAADYIRRGIRIGGRVGGTGGAVAGGLVFGLPKSHINESGEKKKFTAGQRVARGVVGAATLGYAGHQLGGMAGGARNAYKAFKGHHVQKPDWLKNVKTKAESKAAWKMEAMRTHPDHNQGVDKGFDKAKSEWDRHKDLFKEAMLHAFADELEKIAALGALIGGAAGYKLSPNTPRGKVMGTLIGAGAGHALQGIGGMAKRKIIDEPHAREERELYGYQPYAQASQAQNFY